MAEAGAATPGKSFGQVRLVDERFGEFGGQAAGDGPCAGDGFAESGG